jgi:hypothetical protein
MKTRMDARTAASILVARMAAADVNDLADQIGVPFPQWAHACHRISLQLLRTGAFGPGRVARGFAPNVGIQHSWMVLGEDCYDPGAIIVDPTLWSYDPAIQGILVGQARGLGHRPHGAGSIWSYGKPVSAGGPAIALTPAAPLSSSAKMFLDMLGPLDRQGWGVLAECPVEGWPAGEILGAMDDTKDLTALVPIDTLGMTTDRNPGGLYR